MQIQWYGQSAFALRGDGATVFIDPFGDMSGLVSRDLQFDYPPIDGVDADVLLVTHEHGDHNAVEVIDGSPAVLRTIAGTHASPLGQIVGVASEHDDKAGTERGPNTIFVFTLDGVRVAHFGDFGQLALRDEQAAAVGDVDLLILPVGGGPTIDAEQAYAIVERLKPRWVVPMHYGTHRVNFLAPADDFLAKFGDSVYRADGPTVDLAGVADGEDGAVVVVPAAP
jgi:L-ascorbate metabolism protein UlaG (beta-lactamase superfamily)